MKNKIKGGKADKMSLEDIARKHSVFLGTIKKEFEMGLKVEREHTTDPEKAEEITMDHLVELPDYYTRLAKMEKEGESKLEEPKEVTGAASSGSFEAGMSMPIMKRDIQNFKLKSSEPTNNPPPKRANKPPKPGNKPQKEVKEVTGSGVSAGAMYDAPIGHKQKDPLALDNVSSNESASITAASSKDMIATKKGFPRFGGPDAKFVEIKDKCKKFPYCNQMSGYDNLILKEAVRCAAKKYGISTKEVEAILLKESKRLSK